MVPLRKKVLKYGTPKPRFLDSHRSRAMGPKFGSVGFETNPALNGSINFLLCACALMSSKILQ